MNKQKKFKSITIGIPVKNPGASLKWYKNLFGDVKVIEPAKDVIELQLNDETWLQLIQADKKTESGSILRLEVEDIKAAELKLNTLNIISTPIKSVEGVISFVEFEDLDGNKLSFCELH